jgi:tetratricopeptide (TPR) repeat protein
MKQNLLVLFLFVCSLLSAQSADSLVATLPRVKNDIERADLLNAIADAYKVSDPSKMGQYAGKALDLSHRIKYRAAEGNALLNLGNAGILSGDYAKALENFTKAQNLFGNELASNPRDAKIKAGLAKAYGSIGIVFSEQSDYTSRRRLCMKRSTNPCALRACTTTSASSTNRCTTTSRRSNTL